MKTGLNLSYPCVDPGDFRHQITLLSEVLGTDTAGSNVSYQPGQPPVRAWAKVDYLRGTELIKSGQDVSQAYIKVTTWFRPEFSVTSRIQLPSGAQFIVQNVENVKQMSVYMVLTCQGIGNE